MCYAPGGAFQKVPHSTRRGGTRRADRCPPDVPHDVDINVPDNITAALGRHPAGPSPDYVIDTRPARRIRSTRRTQDPVSVLVRPDGSRVEWVRAPDLVRVEIR